MFTTALVFWAATPCWPAATASCASVRACSASNSSVVFWASTCAAASRSLAARASTALASASAVRDWGPERSRRPVRRCSPRSRCSSWQSGPAVRTADRPGHRRRPAAWAARARRRGPRWPSATATPGHGSDWRFFSRRVQHRSALKPRSHSLVQTRRYLRVVINVGTIDSTTATMATHPTAIHASPQVIQGKALIETLALRSMRNSSGTEHDNGGQDRADDPRKKCLQQERQHDVDVGCTNQPHDSDLPAPGERRHANGIADLQHGAATKSRAAMPIVPHLRPLSTEKMGSST